MSQRFIDLLASRMMDLESRCPIDNEAYTTPQFVDDM